MVVWVYAGGGYSELGIIPWLNKHFPDVQFERRLPQKRKPGPRPGKEIVGGTGADLARQIARNLDSYWQSDAADVLLVIDDTDCAHPHDRRRMLQGAMSKVAIEDGKPCIVIGLAVPEIEVWLLADWSNTFGVECSNREREMRRELVKQAVIFESLQEFDCYGTCDKRRSGECKKTFEYLQVSDCDCGKPKYCKISEVIRDTFSLTCTTGPRYSKATDTPRLLLRIDPHQVAERCPDFKLFWHSLNACLTVK